MLVNKETFNLKSTITDDWGGSHRIAVDLEALREIGNWEIEVDLPADYEIDQIYGAKLIEKGGKTYISGENSSKQMVVGEKAEIVLIIDEGNSGSSAPISTQFLFAGSASANPAPANSASTNTILDAQSQITEDWDGGYKLELNIAAQSEAKGWQLDFTSPHTIKEVYGVDLVDNGDGKYTIKGQNDQKNLQSGQSIKPVFIIEDGGQAAKAFDIVGSDMMVEAEPMTETATPAPAPSSIETIAETPVTAEPEASPEAGNISATPSIVEDWDGGYKLEVELKAEGNANNWQVDFNLPYQIEETYGVDIVDNGNGNYTITGQNDQANLQSGQSIKPVFIVEDGGAKAVNPEFGAEVSIVEAIETSEPVSTPAKTPAPSAPVNIPSDNGESVGQRGQFAYGEALQKNFLFLEANRSGPLPDDNRLEWRSDATVNDGSDVGRDLNGGYYDAGDHIKFIQPMAFSNTMLAWGGADYKQAYAQSGQLDELLEAVKWGTDWFLKAHEMDGSGNTERLWVQVGDKTDHYHWVPPEEIANRTDRPSFAIDRNNPGSDAAAGTASALASAAVLFRGTDDAYADELVKNAEALYEFAETYRGKYSDSVPAASPFYTSWSGDGDELALGGAWLYRATGDSKYLGKAESHFKNNIGSLGDWSYATDDHSYGAATLLAKESSDPFFKEQTTKWLDTWVNGGGNVKYTSGGFAHRANWASVPLNMSAAFAAEWYNDNVEANSKYGDFANSQVDYVLGDNPANFSYVVGFGDNYAKRTHHRGSAGTAPMDGSSRENDNLLYGAVVGGPGAVDDFSHNDRRDDWVTNEVGTSYNAPFAGAAIQQYDNLGGDPLSESELDQLIGVDANGVGF